MPWMTAGETARNHWPNFNMPAANWIKACEQHDRAEHLDAVRLDEFVNEHGKPAAGPLTCNGEPAITPTTMPPMMPVMMPAVGGRPEASAMPMQSGRATRKTTTEARRSALTVDTSGREGALVPLD